MATDGRQVQEKVLSTTVTRDIHIKTTTQCHLHLSGSLLSKTQERANAGEEAGGNINGCSRYGKQSGGPT